MGSEDLNKNIYILYGVQRDCNAPTTCDLSGGRQIKALGALKWACQSIGIDEAFTFQLTLLLTLLFIPASRRNGQSYMARRIGSDADQESW